MKDRAVFSYRVATAMHDAWDLGWKPDMALRGRAAHDQAGDNHKKG